MMVTDEIFKLKKQNTDYYRRVNELLVEREKLSQEIDELKVYLSAAISLVGDDKIIISMMIIDYIKPAVVEIDVNEGLITVKKGE